MSESRRLTIIAVSLLSAVVVWLLPTPVGLSSSGQRLIAVTLLMALLWVTQALPIAVTAVIPLFAYPLLGIRGADDVSATYINAHMFLYLGGMLLSLGIERWGLHRRMALRIIAVIGTSPRRLVYGFMIATAFLSMWISNTATTMLMLPIALALLATYEEMLTSSAAPPLQRAGLDTTKHLGTALMLGIAYSASAGGLSTPVGTPTNIAYLGYWSQSQVYGDAPIPSIAEWMFAFLPLSLAMLVAIAIVLTWGMQPLAVDEDAEEEFFARQLRSLGKASPGERRMFVVFLTTALLWVFRKPLAFGDFVIHPGWSDGYSRLLIDVLHVDPSFIKGAVQDSTVAMLMAVLIFVLPGRHRVSDAHPEPKWEPLLDWATAERRLPWGMLLLFGGGFAIADAFAATGLSEWVGKTFADAAQGVHPVWIVLGVCLLVTFLTEFTTNVATVSTMLPVLLGMALHLEIDPRLLMLPATISGSCAFMLPIATPPNTIVFGSGRIEMREMVRYGVLLNLIGAVLTTAITFWVVVPLLDLSVSGLPTWAQ